MNRSFCLVRSALALNSRIASCALEPRASVLFQLTSSRSARQRGFSSEGGTEDSLHSSDIAFKPAESGWGAGKKYAQNFDTIFSQIQKTTKQSNDTTTPTTSYPPCKEGELA